MVSSKAVHGWKSDRDWDGVTGFQRTVCLHHRQQHPEMFRCRNWPETLSDSTTGDGTSCCESNLSGERLLLIDENGHSCIVKVGPKFEVLGEGQLTDVFWSTPAVGDGLIIFRGVESIYCVRVDSAGAGPSKK